MNGDKSTLGRTAGLFLGAAALRLALFTIFPGLPDLLTGRVEISTPVTSFKRLQEGLFLYNHNVSPYDGGVYHQAPLFLPLFSLLPSSASFPILTYLLYIAVDLLSADALVTIAESGEAGASALFASPRRGKRWSGVVVAAIYLFDPYTIATCIGRPTSVFTTCAILHAIAKAVSGRPVGAMVALALAAYLSMYPLLLLPPLLLLCYDRHTLLSGSPPSTTTDTKSDSPPPPPPHVATMTTTRSGPVAFATTHLLVFSGILAALLGMSSLITAAAGGARWWEFLGSTYGVQLALSDPMPNVGLWWYFFVEMFDPFRNFFLAVFWLHLSSYCPALCLRARRQPLAVLVLLLGIFAIFKPYPSISDTSLFLALVPLYRHIFPLMRYTFVIFAVMLYATFLGPAFWHLWIYAGSGNANFFYAITLVWSLGQSLLVCDLTFAVLRDEWEVERPEMVGKDVRQI